ncbi:DUF2157 domain-containing protein [Alkalibacillus silvisoli]|uniref:DUF2157 domain-containing protein n=1 Tax=Alkalibacillus silvisoli TaxID=392823 RepID=A0ABP3JIS8_9BACI
MKRGWIEAESKEWVEEGLIDQKQRQAIVSRYKRHSTPTLFFFLAAILIGLACLSLVAANWTAIHHLFRVLIILGFMSAFYFVGYRAFIRGHHGVGVFAYVVALSAFGSGIFLLGDMYHFSMNSTLPFFMWGIAALLIYLSQPHVFIWVFGLIVVFVGQMLATIQLHDFDWFLLALFVIAFGTTGYLLKQKRLMWLFTSLLAVQLFVFSVSELEFYWFTIFALTFYLVSYGVKFDEIQKPLQGTAVISMFIFVVFQALLFDPFVYSEAFVLQEIYYLFLIPFLSLVILLAILNQEKVGLTQLVLFLPVFVWPEYTTLLATFVLFTFSVGKMVEGDQLYEESKVKYGIVAFLISIGIVYIEMAWDFLDRTFFFLMGGLVLFGVGMILNRYQRERLKGSDEE